MEKKKICFVYLVLRFSLTHKYRLLLVVFLTKYLKENVVYSLIECALFSYPFDDKTKTITKITDELK